MQGWVKLHREITDKAIWSESTPEQKVILVTLLMMANYKEKEWEFKGERYVAKPGQFVTSLPKIAEKAGVGISIQNVRTALARFEKYEFLTGQSSNRNRLITISNWALYQGFEEETEEDLTGRNDDTQQAANRQLTANKKERTKELKDLKDLRPLSSEKSDVISEQIIPVDLEPENQSEPINMISDKTVETFEVVEVSKALKPVIVINGKDGKTKYKYSETDMDNTWILWDYICDNMPGTKKPNLDKWANTFRLIREKNGYTDEAVKYIIHWSQNSSFWRLNIRCPDKIRDEWARWVALAKEDYHKARVVPLAGNRPPTSVFTALKEKLNREEV